MKREEKEMFIMGVITGALLGGSMVLLLLCIVMTGGRADWEMEYQSQRDSFGMTEAERALPQKALSEKALLKRVSVERTRPKRKSKKVSPDTRKDQKQILFVDTNNQELFWIEDGDCIELFSENGDRQTCLCHYLDRRHASIDGKRWELLTFARWMKKRGITYIPSTQQRRKGGVVA